METHLPRRAFWKLRTEPAAWSAPRRRPAPRTAPGSAQSPGRRPHPWRGGGETVTRSSASDSPLTASRDCRRKRRGIKYPQAAANATAERGGLLDFERRTQTPSRSNIMERSPVPRPCAKRPTCVLRLLRAPRACVPLSACCGSENGSRGGQV